ncbi:MAG TPA: lamin tail domain-containing protein [Verrucomicrobiae bacterium]
MPVAITSQPQNQTVAELAAASFTVAASGNPPPTYQWYKNDMLLPDATNATYAIAAAPLSDNGAQFKVVAANTVSNVNYSVTSSNATLNVIADTNAPTIVNVGSTYPNTVTVSFSEPVRADTATNVANYSITSTNGNLIISNATLLAGQSIVVLTTSPQTLGTFYVLTVNGIQDVSAAANQIATNTQAGFLVLSFVQADVGNPPIAGTVTAAGNGYDITASGRDIGGTSDQFTINYQQRTGDFDLKVRLEGLTLSDVWAKAGLMARETLATNSRYAGTFATPSISGSFFQYRLTTGGGSTNAGSFPVTYPNTWLRLKRAANLFTGLASPDGANWVELGNFTIAMPSTVFIGMAVSGRSASQTTTAQFRDFMDVIGAGPAVTVQLPVEPLGPSSRKTGLAISEILYHPRTVAGFSNSLEFIELFNSQAFDERIGGYRISGSVDYLFPTNTVIKSGGFIVVAREPAFVQTYYGLSGVLGPWIGASSNGLPGGSGTVRLRNRAGAVMLEVNYQGKNPWPIAADGAGHSLVLARPSYGEGSPRAWSASDSIDGSPGKPEPFTANPLRSVVINEFLANSDVAEDYIELYNHSNQPVDLSGAWLTDEAGTNKFRIPNGTMIASNGFVVFYESALGFALNAAGERIFLVNSNQNRVIDAIDFEPQASGISSGRYPNGAPSFYPLATQTPGAGNSTPWQSPVVINEIMFNPVSGDKDDEFVELYNRSANPTNVGGWKFTDGIDFTIPNNTTIPVDGYLVIARKAARLRTNYLNLNSANTVGDYDGNLSNGGERLALARPTTQTFTNTNNVVITLTNYVVVNEVTYGDGGRWGHWADGGGSSLELIDPRSDNRQAANWADSDETSKSVWTNIEYTGFTDLPLAPGGGTAGDNLQICLLGIGECLLDDVEVRLTNNPTVNLIGANSSFESGLTGWTPQGSHDLSSIENTGFSGARSLHIRAGSRGDNGANKVRSPALSPAVNNVAATLRAKARWLRGFPELLLRLHGGTLEAVGRLPVPTNLGTPGARNSRAVSNAGPAIWAVQHSPVLPTAGESVVVTARASDPDGLAAVVLKYRLDALVPSPFSSINMVDDGTGSDAIAGDGIYSATLPGQAAGVLYGFYVEAADNASPRATNTFPQELFPPAGLARVFPNDSPSRECLIRFGERQMPGSFATYHLWITAGTSNRWYTRDNLNNAEMDGTFVYNNYRGVYNALPLFAGSPWHRGAMTTGPMGAQRVDFVMDFPSDDRMLGATDFVLNNPGNPAGTSTTDLSAQTEQTSYIIFNEIGVHYNQRRYIHYFINGNQRSTTSDRPGNFIFEDSQQPNGDVIEEWYPDDTGGDFFKIEDWFEFNDAATGFNNNDADLERRNIAGTSNIKLAPYRFMWRKRAVGAGESASDYASIFSLIDAASPAASPTASAIPDIAKLNAIANIEQWMRIFAVQHAVGNWDSYGFERGKNCYAYRGQNNNRFELMTWDIDFTMGVGGHSAGTANLLDINDPRVLAMMRTGYFVRGYWRALRDIINGPLRNSFLDPILDAKQAALRDNNVNIDPNFVANQIKPYIAARNTYLAGQIPSANFVVNGPTTITTTNNFVIITGTAPLEVKDLLLLGYYPVTFSDVPATAWSVRLIVPPGTTQLIIQGYDTAGNLMSNIRATNTVNYTGALLSPVGALVMTEVNYRPAALNAGYIELVNLASSYTFDVSGWRIDGVEYTFPPNSFINPRSTNMFVQNRTAFAAAYGSSIPVFAEFPGTLDPAGEKIALVKPGATPAQDVQVDALRYEPRSPWPTNGLGTGMALQVIDPTQDNSRPSNWGEPQGWRYSSLTGIITGNTNPLTLNGGTNLAILQPSVGDFYIDDIDLVQGAVAGVGPNLLLNGDFESPLSGTWNVPTNMANSDVSTNFAHSGNSSLHIVTTSPSQGLPTAIYQTLNVQTNTLHTLSFWFHTTLNASNFNVRTLPGNGLNIATNTRPVLATPGAPNTTAGTLPPYPLLWINEIQPNNAGGITDNAGQHDPWIELLNSDTNALPLDPYFLTDDYSLATKWQFPTGAVINPGQHLLLFADNQPGQSLPTELHLPFLLSRTNGAIALYRLLAGVPQVLDYMNYATIGTNYSYGSYPEGQLVDRQLFYFPTPGTSNNPVNIPVRINEWLASNTNNLVDPMTGTREDWFELYNFGTTVADLSGCYLTDNLGNKTKWAVPYGTSIAPGAFLFVWADNVGNSNALDLHANFNLKKEGEELGLFGPNGETIDTVVFEGQNSDISQGRFPDAGSPIYFMPPTPGAPNVINHAPTLGGISNRTVHAGETVNFTASASDSDSPPQVLSYTLGAGAPTGAGLNSSSGFFSWTPTYLQAPTTNLLAVRVADNGVPSLSATQTVTITVLPAPHLTGIMLSATNVSLTWDATAGKTYQVDSKDDLNEANWVTVPGGNSIFVNSTSWTFTDNRPPSRMRFYRILQLD